MSPVKLALAQSKLRRTPDQILGPLYPAMKTADLSGDLTRVPGRTGRAEGQILNVMGRVLNIKGEPVRGTKLEIWQANSYGRYVHLADRNPAPWTRTLRGLHSSRPTSMVAINSRPSSPGPIRSAIRSRRHETSLYEPLEVKRKNAATGTLSSFAAPSFAFREEDGSKPRPKHTSLFLFFNLFLCSARARLFLRPGLPPGSP
jgi:Dioxygenase